MCNPDGISFIIKLWHFGFIPVLSKVMTFCCTSTRKKNLPPKKESKYSRKRKFILFEMLATLGLFFRVYTGIMLKLSIVADNPTGFERFL